jgi:hypothetical protein
MMTAHRIMIDASGTSRLSSRRRDFSEDSSCALHSLRQARFFSRFSTRLSAIPKRRARFSTASSTRTTRTRTPRSSGPSGHCSLSECASPSGCLGAMTSMAKERSCSPLCSWGFTGKMALATGAPWKGMRVRCTTCSTRSIHRRLFSRSILGSSTTWASSRFPRHSFASRRG